MNQDLGKAELKSIVKHTGRVVLTKKALEALTSGNVLTYQMGDNDCEIVMALLLDPAEKEGEKDELPPSV